MDDEQLKKVLEKFRPVSDEERDELRKNLDHLFKRMEEILKNPNLQTYENVSKLNREIIKTNIVNPKYRLLKDPIYSKFADLAHDIGLQTVIDKLQSVIKNKTNS